MPHGLLYKQNFNTFSVRYTFTASPKGKDQAQSQEAKAEE